MRHSFGIPARAMLDRMCVVMFRHVSLLPSHPSSLQPSSATNTLTSATTIARFVLDATARKFRNTAAARASNELSRSEPSPRD